MNFFPKVRALLGKAGKNSTPCAHKYHLPDERNPSGLGWHRDASFCIEFKKRQYGIRVCQIDADGPIQVFVARIQGPEGTGNNFHVSFSSEHLDGSVLYIEPSLRRCRQNRFVKPPKRIGNYPALVCGTGSRFIVGPLDDYLFSRIFSVVDAKFDSLK